MNKKFSLHCDICNFKTLSLSHVKLDTTQVETSLRKEAFERQTQGTQVSPLPLSPEGSDTVFVGMVSEFAFPFSNVSFSVCCNCQLRPKRCIAGGEEHTLFKGPLLLAAKQMVNMFITNKSLMQSQNAHGLKCQG